MDAGFWLVSFIVLLVIEILTLGLTTIWFAGGALIAWIMAMSDCTLPLQVAAFLVVSFALLFLTRPIAVKYFNNRCEKTNVDGLIGKTAVVTEKIDGLRSAGRVVVNGMEWSAASVCEDGVIEEDSVVVIEQIRGVKLMVRLKEDV